MTYETLATTIVSYYKQRAEFHSEQYAQSLKEYEDYQRSCKSLMCRMKLRDELEKPVRTIGAVPELKDVIACLVSKVSSLEDGDVFAIYADPQVLDQDNAEDTKVAQSVVMFCPGGSLIVATTGYVDGLPMCSKVLDFNSLEHLNRADIFDAAEFAEVSMNHALAMQGREMEIAPMTIGMRTVEIPTAHMQEAREQQRWQMLESKA